MAHLEQMSFLSGVKQRFPSHFHRAKVLEIGSYNVNGTCRILFPDAELYIGLDLAPGRDVDQVYSGALYNTDERFDVVISTECFEHAMDWPAIFTNMVRLCRPDGLVVFTCAANERQEHGTLRTSPADSAVATTYYKNLNVLDFEAEFRLRDWFYWYGWEARDHDLYFAALKR